MNEPINEPLKAIEEAYLSYREELKELPRGGLTARGLFGFGRQQTQTDRCHDRFDERLKNAVDDLAQSGPDSETALRAVRTLILREDAGDWPTTAQWMLRAAERHALKLIPCLNGRDKSALYHEYGARYRPYDRLPAQQQVLDALGKERK